MNWASKGSKGGHCCQHSKERQGRELPSGLPPSLPRHTPTPLANFPICPSFSPAMPISPSALPSHSLPLLPEPRSSCGFLQGSSAILPHFRTCSPDFASQMGWEEEAAEGEAVISFPAAMFLAHPFPLNAMGLWAFTAHFQIFCRGASPQKCQKSITWSSLPLCPFLATLLSVGRGLQLES